MSTSDLPDPLVSSGTDITGLDGFMLDTERLMASELWALANGEEFKAALGLWCRAWKQDPPGSLPNDPRVLAAFSGAGPRWQKVRAMALRGFVLCSDGRLYHQVLCADVKRAALKKAQRRERTLAASAARWRERHGKESDIRNGLRDGAPTDVTRAQYVTSVTDSVTDSVTMSHRRDRDRDREEREDPGTNVPAADAAQNPLETIWKTGVQLICASGSRETTARSFLGGLCKSYGDAAVAEKIAHLAVHPAADPRGWLRGALGNGKTRGDRGARSAADRVRDANPITPDPEIDRYL